MRRLLFSLWFSLLAIAQSNGQDMENINLANEYYQNGEMEKAKEVYDKLARNSLNIPLIHNNYFDLLITQGEYDQATRYIERRIRENPTNNIYQVDKGIILKRSGKRQEELDYFNQLIKDISIDEYQTRMIAQYLIKNQMFDYALKLYQTGRSLKGNEEIYALELASLYRILNNKEQMITEYLSFASQNPNNLTYIKNILQSSLIETQDLDMIEQKLIERVQRDPDNRIFADLLIWVNVQQRNFYEAFIQARAYDRRFDKDGGKIMEVGFLALDNKAYNDAVQIFDYLCNNYHNTYLYPIAKRYKIQSREELVKNTYPVDLNEIRKLSVDYHNLTEELGIGPAVAEAMMNKAHLHAFYLNEIDSAIDILNQIVSIPKINPDLVARCKLDLGDIYILAGQPWESALLYAQVEKSRKDTPIGYEAKLKNARLSYYKGEFLLAEEQLNILKLATSREIANDAMQLSIFIKDNTGLDTSDFLLRKFSSIELLLFQNKKREALDSLMEMLSLYGEEIRLADDILWQIAKIRIEMGDYEKALANLDDIIDHHGEDLLGDDAMFKKAEVYQYHTRDTEGAKQVYRDFLIRYPGSLFTTEARKRFRTLRGDVIN